MISEELSAWLVARREVLDWTDQAALISLAVQAGGDAAFLTAVKAAGPALSKAVAGYDEELFKVGPKGYSHGWVKVGEVQPKDLRVEQHGSNPFKMVVSHPKTDKPIATVKHDYQNGSYTVTHADGKKIGTFPSMYEGNKAIADYHNEHYAAFNRDKEPLLAGYHDAMAGRSMSALELEGRTGAYRGDYLTGRAQALGELNHQIMDRLPASKAQTANKVGPKGYIHGWIKVGDAADSLDLHTDKSTGKLTPKRAALHDKIVNDTLAGHESKGKPVATFLGGGSASGKSTIMKDSAGKLVIDADAMKARLPEYQKMMKSGDKRAAAFAHGESSHLTNRALEEAAKRKVDFTLDGTGDSSYEKLKKKVDAARAGGHAIDAKYVTVDTEEAIKRSNKRAARTGRKVPESAIRAIHAGVSRTFKDAVDHNLFDTAELWDNNGREPKLIGRKLADGPFQVHDRAAWEKFLAKGQEVT